MSQRRDSLSVGQVLFKNGSMTVKAPSSSAAHSSTGEQIHMDVSYRMSTVAPSVALKRIVSGGQTGVDRGALDAALTTGFECGGWAPGDRMAEDGIIPDWYPLTILPNGNYRQRTRLNVVDSDGTAILYDGSMNGGTRLMRDLCQRLNRPCILISARETPDPIAAAVVVKFIENNNIETLNVAGPRASGWKDGYAFSFAVIEEAIRNSRMTSASSEHMR
jgi:putative molybdenum carrier protein